jgi:hypothetical protein
MMVVLDAIFVNTSLSSAQRDPRTSVGSMLLPGGKRGDTLRRKRSSIAGPIGGAVLPAGALARRQDWTKTPKCRTFVLIQERTTKVLSFDRKEHLRW